MEKKKIIGFYDYTVILTYLGMVLAFLGIINVLHGEYVNSIMCLLGAGGCDMFDGTVASTKERSVYEKHFGIQIDSLCDLVSFGVLPAIFVYVITGESAAIGALACAFTLCGLIRLAYFNVLELDRQSAVESREPFFLGVPITTSALVLPLIFLLYDVVGAIDTWIFPIGIALLGIGYIVGIRISKPKKVGKIIILLVGLTEMIATIILSGAHII